MPPKKNDPFLLFESWYREAEASEPRDPNAMSLATATSDGRPSVRMVLLKDWSPEGFVFYTNLESRKGSELHENPHAALCIYWKSLGRQIRVEGPVAQVTDAEADAYFNSRPRDSRIGAIASQQSRPLEGILKLERDVARVAARYPLGAIPRPAYWSGFRISPEVIEFWSERPFRLHERHVFQRVGDGWTEGFLYP